MKKFISVGFATIGSLLLIFAIVFTSMEIVINNETFINNEFTKLGVNTSMGMSNNDLVRSTVRLIDYMQGDVDDINVSVTVNGEKVPMFALEQEVEHMKDVRQLYLQIKGYRDTGVLVMLVLFLFSAIVNFRKAPQMLAQGYLSGSFIALLFFGFLGTWALMDFTSFWTFFHQMLFWNDLWLFDATESRMINMLPEQMFSDIVGQIFLYAGIVIAALIAISIVCLVVSSESYQRRRLEARKRKKARQAAALARKKAREKAKAEAEKAKRIAAKKAQKAAAAKEREKRAAAAAKARARAEKKRARNPEDPFATDGDGYDGAQADAYDSSVSISLGEGVSEELTEGYASDFFQSATYAEYASGGLGVTETTTNTTVSGSYPESHSAEFFKNYAAARGVTQASGRTVSEMQFADDGFSVQHGAPESPLADADYRETYVDAEAHGASARTQRPSADTGRRSAAKKPAAKKASSKPKSKKRARIQDDTGFFDD